LFKLAKGWLGHTQKEHPPTGSYTFSQLTSPKGIRSHPKAVGTKSIEPTEKNKELQEYLIDLRNLLKFNKAFLMASQLAWNPLFLKVCKHLRAIFILERLPTPKNIGLAILPMTRFRSAMCKTHEKHGKP